MTERSQRCQKSEIDSRAAALGGRHEIRKRLPFPTDSSGQRVERNLLDIDQVPRRDLADRRLARRDSDTAVSHHHGGNPMPRSATYQRIPANLRVVVSMWIDEAGRDDQV